MPTKLDKLYADLTAASGVTRTRDVRLEKIAMDRALEAMFTVGTDGNAGIPHPITQLQARTFPLQDPTAAVHENAVWDYSAEWQPDPWAMVTDAWMSSPAHLANLKRETDTHWGLGFHHEPPHGTQRNERYYFIAVFTEPLTPLVVRKFGVLPGRYWGIQTTADGEVIGRKEGNIVTTQGATYDAREDIADRGPHLHVVSGLWKNFWVPESASLYASRPS